MKRNALVLFFLLGFSTLIQAEPRILLCEFDRMADPDGYSWPREPLKLTFIVGPEEGAAQMVGQLGTTTVQVVKNVGAVTFAEITDTGNIVTTTVLDDGRAVHSRNMVVLEDLFPSQYYGKCVPK